jgi:Protein of unknown function (DUF2961)
MKVSTQLWLALLLMALHQPELQAADPNYDGFGGILGNLIHTSKSQSRSLCPENFTGEKGKAGMATNGTGSDAAQDLGRGWKISPSVVIKARSTFTLGQIQGPGSIQHIWMTPTENWRHSILRFYWDGAAQPSVECPVGDFFACGWGEYCQISSLAVCVNPGSAFNCYWPMPFRKSARITLENTDDKDMVLYYQVDYLLSELPADAAYFHAQFRHEEPLKQKGLYTILDGVEGQGQYVGTYLAWETHSPGWWGEGEVKFYLDGDKEFPTICSTGTEDYFCGSYDFVNPGTKKYQAFSTPYTGLAQVIPADKKYETGQKFGLYRWHITDPVRFQKSLKVTIQALGWQSNGRYLQLDDDISSVAFWYQKDAPREASALSDAGKSRP